MKSPRLFSIALLAAIPFVGQCAPDVSVSGTTNVYAVGCRLQGGHPHPLRGNPDGSIQYGCGQLLRRPNTAEMNRCLDSLVAQGYAGKGLDLFGACNTRIIWTQPV